jgi:hypothetical protein
MGGGMSKRKTGHGLNRCSFLSLSAALAASVASGKLEGMVYVLGFFAGLAVFPNLFDALGSFYGAGSLGAITLFDFLPVHPLRLSVLFVAVAVASFFGVVRLERWASARWSYLRY